MDKIDLTNYVLFLGTKRQITRIGGNCQGKPKDNKKKQHKLTTVFYVQGDADVYVS